MTKSELIERIAEQQDQLSPKDVELGVKLILEEMSQALAIGERIEVRGFGSFSLHYHAARKFLSLFIFKNLHNSRVILLSGTGNSVNISRCNYDSD